MTILLSTCLVASKVLAGVIPLDAPVYSDAMVKRADTEDKPLQFPTDDDATRAPAKWPPASGQTIDFVPLGQGSNENDWPAQDANPDIQLRILKAREAADADRQMVFPSDSEDKPIQFPTDDDETKAPKVSFGKPGQMRDFVPFGQGPNDKPWPAQDANPDIQLRILNARKATPTVEDSWGPTIDEPQFKNNQGAKSGQPQPEKGLPGLEIAWGPVPRSAESPSESQPEWQNLLPQYTDANNGWLPMPSALLKLYSEGAASTAVPTFENAWGPIPGQPGYTGKVESDENIVPVFENAWGPIPGQSGYTGKVESDQQMVFPSDTEDKPIQFPTDDDENRYVPKPADSVPPKGIPNPGEYDGPVDPNGLEYRSGALLNAQGAAVAVPTAFENAWGPIRRSDDDEVWTPEYERTAYIAPRAAATPDSDGVVYHPDGALQNAWGTFDLPKSASDDGVVYHPDGALQNAWGNFDLPQPAASDDGVVYHPDGALQNAWGNFDLPQPVSETTAPAKWPPAKPGTDFVPLGQGPNEKDWPAQDANPDIGLRMLKAREAADAGNDGLEYRTENVQPASDAVPTFENAWGPIPAQS